MELSRIGRWVCSWAVADRPRLSRGGNVKYNERADLDPSQMGGGGGNRGKIAIGGGAGLLIAPAGCTFRREPW